MSTAAVAPTASPLRAAGRPAVRRLSTRVATLGWPLLVVVLVIGATALPLLFDQRYYFTGDTESGAYGQWYAIGTRILEGRWGDVLNPTVWQAGVYLADGAWGFYSPVLWGIGLLTHAVDDVLALVFWLKAGMLVTAGLGSYALARSFGATRPWAAIAGVAVPLNGFTGYQDVTSWITGALSWCFLPWAWAGLRAFVHRGRSILVALVPAAALLGIVYTHATLVLITVVLAVAVETLVARRRAAIVRMLVAGVAIALMVVVAHLPALLVYPDTARTSEVTPPGAMVAGPTALLQMPMPFGHADMWATNGDVAVGHSFTYVIWLLPLIGLVRWRALGRLLLRRLSLPLVLVATVLFVSGPSQIGPLRWPGRVMPYVAVAVTVLLVLALSRARAARPGVVRMAVVAALFGAAVWVTIATSGATDAVVVGSVGLGLLLAGLAGLLRQRGPRARARGARGPVGRSRQRVALLLAAIVTAALVLPQHAAVPSPGGPKQGLATSLRTYHRMLAGAVGDVFVVGDERSAPGPAMSRQAALGNSWYLTDAAVQNTYTTLQSEPFTQLLCMGVKGSTCSRSVHTLFEREPGTGRPWADLLGISSILLIKSSFASSAWQNPRPGWHVVSDTTETRLLVRNRPIQGAGGVVWSSSGTVVHADRTDALSVRFTVRRAGPDALVTLSRLPWTGYTVTGGAAIVHDPVGGMLLTLRLPPGAAGRTFTVGYAPPGAALVRAASLGVVAITALWLLLSLLALALPGLRFTGVRRRFGGPGRAASHPSSPSGPSGGTDAAVGTRSTAGTGPAAGSAVAADGPPRAPATPQAPTSGSDPRRAGDPVATGAAPPGSS